MKRDIVKFKFFIFDLDGVLFNSKRNMEKAWSSVKNKYHIKVSFNSYFDKIGMPFDKILVRLKIKPNNKIFKTFQLQSIKYIDLVKPYPSVKKSLEIFKKKKIKFSILTSKDLKRSKLLLKKYNILPETIHCPKKKLRGKPFPDHILDCLKKNKIKKKDVCFVGDTKIDNLAARRAGIEFIFAKYGYGVDEKLYNNKITKFKDIKKFLHI